MNAKQNTIYRHIAASAYRHIAASPSPDVTQDQQGKLDAENLASVAQRLGLNHPMTAAAAGDSMQQVNSLWPMHCPALGLQPLAVAEDSLASQMFNDRYIWVHISENKLCTCSCKADAWFPVHALLGVTTSCCVGPNTRSAWCQHKLLHSLKYTTCLMPTKLLHGPSTCPAWCQD